MKIIDKYISKQILSAMLFGIVIFIVIWISPEILFKVIHDIVNGKTTLAQGIKILFFYIPEILGKAIPIGLMLGSVFVFDRLSRDSELTVMRSIGISFVRMASPVIVISIIASLLSFWVNDSLIPYSNNFLKKLKRDESVKNFVFMDKTPTGKPIQIMVVGNYKNNVISSVKLIKYSENFGENNPLISSIITSDNAKIENNSWIIENGTQYDIASNGVYKNIRKFKEMSILSGEKSQRAYDLMINSNNKASEMTLKELQNYLALLKSSDMEDEYRYFLNKYYQRFAQSLSCVFLALLGVLFGFNKPRGKRAIGFVGAVGVVFVYFLIMPFLDALAQTGVLAPLITAWLPNLVILSLIWVLYKAKKI